MLVLNPEQLKAILESTRSIALLPSNLRHAAAIVFAEGYDLQMRVTIGISASELLATALMWEKRPRVSP